MVDYTRAPSGALFSVNAQYKQGTGAGALELTQPVYYNPTTGKWTEMDASALATAGAKKGLVGLVSKACSADGQGVEVCIYDPDLDIGFAVAVGTPVVVSTNAGELAPLSDLTSTNAVTLLFFPTSTTNGILDPIVCGAVVA